MRRNGDSIDEQYVTVLFAGDLVLAHWIEQNVVAMNQALSSLSDAYDHIAAFIGVLDNAPEADQPHEFTATSTG